MKRRLAREIAVQSLYQMEMNEVTVDEAVAMLLAEARDENEIEADKVDDAETGEFAKELIHGVSEHRTAIDSMLQQYLTGWQVDQAVPSGSAGAAACLLRACIPHGCPSQGSGQRGD